MDILVDFVNFIIAGLGEWVNSVLGTLAKGCPLQWQNNIDNEILAWVNWLIPFGEMVVVAELWLVGIALWYVVRIGLNYIKAAGG